MSLKTPATGIVSAKAMFQQLAAKRSARPEKHFSLDCDFNHSARVGPSIMYLTVAKRRRYDPELEEMLKNWRKVARRSRELIEQTKELLQQSRMLMDFAKQFGLTGECLAET